MHFQDQTQDTVSGGMLRAKIDLERFELLERPASLPE